MDCVVANDNKEYSAGSLLKRILIFFVVSNVFVFLISFFFFGSLKSSNFSKVFPSLLNSTIDRMKEIDNRLIDDASEFVRTKSSDSQFQATLNSYRKQFLKDLNSDRSIEILKNLALGEESIEDEQESQHNPNDNHRPNFAVVIVSAPRSRQYLWATAHTLINGLSQNERRNSHVIAFDTQTLLNTLVLPPESLKEGRKNLWVEDVNSIIPVLDWQRDIKRKELKELLLKDLFSCIVNSEALKNKNGTLEERYNAVVGNRLCVETSDYTIALRLCRILSLKYCVILEDDIAVTPHLISKIQQRALPALREANENWLFCKLFYTDAFEGWGEHNLLQLVFASLILAAIFTYFSIQWAFLRFTFSHQGKNLLQSAASRQSYPISSFLAQSRVVWFLLFGTFSHSSGMDGTSLPSSPPLRSTKTKEKPKTAYQYQIEYIQCRTIWPFLMFFFMVSCVIHLWLIGRTNLVRTTFPIGVTPLQNSAMLQGMLYNVRSPYLSALERDLATHVGTAPVDLVIDDGSMKKGRPVFMLAPHLVQHMGAVSSLPGKNDGSFISLYQSSQFDNSPEI